MDEELTLAVFGAHVVGRARGPCCEMCSGPMLWDVFGAHVVGCVRGTCCGTCLGPMLWDVFRAHVVGRVRGPCCETCSEVTPRKSEGSMFGRLGRGFPNLCDNFRFSLDVFDPDWVDLGSPAVS